ncbi:androgen-dependent TFPI-regulating protein isoform X2 [Anabrus simplex]|uniref:androgen-dependent TFPI-regulating protein isoform X2 n=1 Tax=Anabrus simplex TaxID=316456 RepID=UPI0035A3B543
MGKQSGNLFTLLFHTIAVAHHVFVFYCLQYLDYSKTSDTYTNNVKNFPFRFFTVWNFLTASGVPSSLQTRIKKTKHFTFRTFVFPVSHTAVFMFWVLFLVDRKLVFPPEIDNVIPAWVNHAIHTNIIITAVMELATTFHRYPRARNRAIMGITLYIIAYGVCYFSTYFIHGTWLYPVYEVMNWTQRIIFTVFVYLLTVGFYFFGEGLTTKIWENEIQTISRRKVKVK